MTTVSSSNTSFQAPPGVSSQTGAQILQQLPYLAIIDGGQTVRVGAKIIARIERGEVKKPHQKTMVSIAKRLGVPPEEVAIFKARLKLF